MQGVHDLVLSALAPVVLLAAAGYWAGRRGWVAAEAVPSLTQLVFLLLTPALLFRTMAQVQIAQIDPRPVLAYFSAALLLFGLVLWHGRGTREAAVHAMAATFSNTVMIGVPLVTLAYGAPGLVILLTIISLHALVLLTLATVALEFAQLRAEGAAGAARAPWRSVAAAVRNALIHPVPLPIIAGLVWGSLSARHGLALPAALDRTLEVLGAANGPMALLLVGVTLAQSRIGAHWKPALALAATKNLALPALVAPLAAWLFGLRGLPLAVIVVTASLPIGANVFLFAQRYQVEPQRITAAVAISTVGALLTTSTVMLLAQTWIAAGAAGP
jgi:predicted permease